MFEVNYFIYYFTETLAHIRYSTTSARPRGHPPVPHRPDETTLSYIASYRKQPYLVPQLHCPLTRLLTKAIGLVGDVLLFRLRLQLPVRRLLLPQSSGPREGRLRLREFPHRFTAHIHVLLLGHHFELVKEFFALNIELLNISLQHVPQNFRAVDPFAVEREELALRPFDFALVVAEQNVLLLAGIDVHHGFDLFLHLIQLLLLTSFHQRELFDQTKIFKHINRGILNAL